MDLSLKFDCKLKNNSHVLFEIESITNQKTIIKRIKKSTSAKIKEISMPTYYMLEIIAKSFKKRKYQNIPINVVDIP